MAAVLRGRAVWERASRSLWLMPAASVLVSIGAGVALANVQVDPASPVGALVFGGSPDGARALLSTVAGSTITVTSLTFSLTVVALQVAASQFTPRLLRTFLGDRGNQVVISVLLSTFAYTLLVLRKVRSAGDGVDAFVPQLAVTVAILLTLLSVAVLVYFFHHLTQQLRVESVLREVERETLGLVAGRDELDLDGHDPPAMPIPPADAVTVPAARSGYLQAVDPDGLASAAIQGGFVLRIRPAVGTHVSQGSTLAWVWPADAEADAAPSSETSPDADDLTPVIHGSLQLGFERALQQDVAFGIRQLVDIVARALSPGINDPTTAVNAIGTVSVVLCAMADRDLGPAIRVDDAGQVRVVAPLPTFPEILALACDQPLRYGRNEPAVIAELLRMLTDVAEQVAAQPRRDALARQLDVIRPVVDSTSPANRDWLNSLVEECDRTLRVGRRVLAAPDDEVEAPAD